MDRDRFRGCLLGLACGDAVGTAVEFKPRETFATVQDMVGGGPFRLLPGQWTDDTSMALCLAISLLERQGHDPLDQMQRYVRWWKEGYQSSNGLCFDIGNTVAAALQRFQGSSDPLAGSTDPYSAGNGSIMRLAPVPMFYARDPDVAEFYSGDSSKTTHGAEECVDACRFMARVVVSALDGNNKENSLFEHSRESPYTKKIEAISMGSYRDKNRDQIKGSGYVVDSLEAALWSFLGTDSFEGAILKAVNLGDDADTTAAVCGQVAGAFYGVGGIPDSWLAKLTYRDRIESLADQLYDVAFAN